MGKPKNPMPAAKCYVWVKNLATQKRYAINASLLYHWNGSEEAVVPFDPTEKFDSGNNYCIFKDGVAVRHAAFHCAPTRDAATKMSVKKGGKELRPSVVAPRKSLTSVTVPSTKIDAAKAIAAAKEQEALIHSSRKASKASKLDDTTHHVTAVHKPSKESPKKKVKRSSSTENKPQVPLQVISPSKKPSSYPAWNKESALPQYDLSGVSGGVEPSNNAEVSDVSTPGTDSDEQNSLQTKKKDSKNVTEPCVVNVVAKPSADGSDEDLMLDEVLESNSSLGSGKQSSSFVVNGGMPTDTPSVSALGSGRRSFPVNNVNSGVSSRKLSTDNISCSPAASEMANLKASQTVDMVKQLQISLKEFVLMFGKVVDRLESLEKEVALNRRATEKMTETILKMIKMNKKCRISQLERAVDGYEEEEVPDDMVLVGLLDGEIKFLSKHDLTGIEKDEKKLKGRLLALGRLFYGPVYYTYSLVGTKGPGKSLLNKIEGEHTTSIAKILQCFHWAKGEDLSVERIARLLGKYFSEVRKEVEGRDSNRKLQDFQQAQQMESKENEENDSDSEEN